MNALTEDEIQKLEPDIQAALAMSEAKRVERQQKLLIAARGDKKWPFYVTVAIWFCYTLWVAGFMRESKQLSFWITLGVFNTVVMAFAFINHRIDAVVELLKIGTSDFKDKK